MSHDPGAEADANSNERAEPFSFRFGRAAVLAGSAVLTYAAAARILDALRLKDAGFEDWIPGLFFAAMSAGILLAERSSFWLSGLDSEGVTLTRGRRRLRASRADIRRVLPLAKLTISGFRHGAVLILYRHTGRCICFVSVRSAQEMQELMGLAGPV